MVICIVLALRIAGQLGVLVVLVSVAWITLGAGLIGAFIDRLITFFGTCDVSLPVLVNWL